MLTGIGVARSPTLGVGLFVMHDMSWVELRGSLRASYAGENNGLHESFRWGEVALDACARVLRIHAFSAAPCIRGEAGVLFVSADQGSTSGLWLSPGAGVSASYQAGSLLFLADTFVAVPYTGYRVAGSTAELAAFRGAATELAIAVGYVVR